MESVYNNLHPHYRVNIGREDFDSFSELERLGELLEASQAMPWTFLPPPPPEESLLPELAYQPKPRSSSRMAVTEHEVSQDGKASLKSERVPKRKTKGRREKTAAMVSPRQGSQPSLAQPRPNQINEGTPSKSSPTQGVRKINQATYAAEWNPSPQQQYASWYPPYCPPLAPPTRQQLPATELNPNAPAFKAAKVITSAVTPTKGTSRVRPGCWNCGNLGHSFRYCKVVRKAFCYRCGEPDQNAHTCTACAGPVSGNA